MLVWYCFSADSRLRKMMRRRWIDFDLGESVGEGRKGSRRSDEVEWNWIWEKEVKQEMTAYKRQTGIVFKHDDDYGGGVWGLRALIPDEIKSSYCWGRYGVVVPWMNDYLRQWAEMMWIVAYVAVSCWVVVSCIALSCLVFFCLVLFLRIVLLYFGPPFTYNWFNSLFSTLQSISNYFLVIPSNDLTLNHLTPLLSILHLIAYYVFNRPLFTAHTDFQGGFCERYDLQFYGEFYSCFFKSQCFSNVCLFVIHIYDLT